MVRSVRGITQSAHEQVVLMGSTHSLAKKCRYHTGTPHLMRPSSALMAVNSCSFSSSRLLCCTSVLAACVQLLSAAFHAHVHTHWTVHHNAGILACTCSREALPLTALALQRLAVLLHGRAHRTNCFCGQLTPCPACAPRQILSVRSASRGALHARNRSELSQTTASNRRAHLHNSVLGALRAQHCVDCVYFSRLTGVSSSERQLRLPLDK